MTNVLDKLKIKLSEKEYNKVLEEYNIFESKYSRLNNKHEAVYILLRYLDLKATKKNKLKGLVLANMIEDFLHATKIKKPWYKRIFRR